MKKRLIQLAIISTAICFVSAATYAQTGPLRVACGPDMQKFCPGMKGKDARTCLKGFHAQIAPGCMAFLDQAKAQRAGGAMAPPPPAGGSPPAGKDE
jgi:hypothetical protein